MLVQKMMRIAPVVLCLGLWGVCGAAQPAGAADSYSIQVSPTKGEPDVIAAKGTVMIRAKVLRNGLPAPHGTVVNWTFDGSEIWSHKNEAVTLKPTSTQVTGDNGETIYPFKPSKLGLQAGSAGSVKLTGTVAGTSVSGTVDKIAVGFGSFLPDHKVKWAGVEGATGHCGEVRRAAPAGKYFMETCLPTAKQLQAVSGAHRPASVQAARYWTGQGASGKSAGVMVVDLSDGKDFLCPIDKDTNPAVCLR